MEEVPLDERRPLIVVGAVGDGFVAGAGNRMPWHAPGDLKQFRRLTYGYTVIMGRTTWEGLAAPLEGRQNIVLSPDTRFSPNEALRVGSLPEALDRSAGDGPIFVIGGRVPWKEALEVADEIRLTRIYAAFNGNVYFPRIDESIWAEVDREIHHGPVDGLRRRFDFITLRRRERIPRGRK